jgi:outer membrane receptor protein involved in Fe transport
VGCEGNLAPAPGVTVNNPNTRDDNVAFFEDTNKGYRQLAEFASMDFDILPKVLTVTAGIRHYDYKLDQRGWVGTSFGCFEAPAPCYGYGHNEDAEHLNAEYKGFKGRGNISWHITPDVMVYYTYSQGYRPGGFNRTSGTALFAAVLDPVTNTYSKGPAQYIKPLAFAPDTLTNNEIGFKTEFFGHRLLLNGSIYREDWKNVQTALFNPGVLGNLTLATNGAHYRVNGAELQATWRATQELSLMGSISYNDAKQIDSPFLINNNPASPTFGQPITTYYSVVTQGPKTITNTFGSPNTPTAYSPKVQGNLRARYDWNISDYSWFVQGGVLYVGSMYNNTNTDPTVNGDSSAINNINTTLFRFHMDSYTTFDAAFGVAKDKWTAQVFGQNLSNSNASTFTSTAQFVKTEVPLRPRVIGLRIGMKF